MSELSDLFATKDPDEWRKKLATALATEATSYQPIQSWTQGAAKLSQAALAAHLMNQGYGDKQDQLRKQIDAERIASGLEPLPEPKSSGGLFGSGGFFGRGSTPSIAPISTPSAQPRSSSATESPYTTVSTGMLGGGFNGVPLPPQRPAFDRSKFVGEIGDNPGLVPQLASMVRGELGPDATPEQKRIQLATAFDRATARDKNVTSQLQTYTGRQNDPGYYPPQTFQKGTGNLDEFKRDVLDPVLRGTNEGEQRLGFQPTGNASGSVAANGMMPRNGAAPYYTNAGKIGDETYVTHRPDNLARLEASRVPQNFPGYNPQQDTGSPQEASQATTMPPPQGFVQTSALPPPGPTNQMPPPQSPTPQAASPPVQQMAQAPTPPGITQNAIRGPTRDQVLQRIDALTRRGTIEGLREAALLRQKYMTPDTFQMHTTADGRVLRFNPRSGEYDEIMPSGKTHIVGQDAALVDQNGREIYVGKPKNPPAPAGYQWGQDTPEGKKTQIPIEGGPATKLPEGTSGKLAMMDSAMSDWANTRKTLLAPWGVSGSIGSITGSFDVGRAQRNARIAIEAALRTMSGAAVPETEVNRYADLYMPGVRDSAQTAAQKLDKLEMFIRGARENALQGHVPAPTKAAPADPFGLR